MELTSDAFRHEARIPSKYTCDGDEVSPPLTVSGVPAGAATLALVVDDPDAPSGTWDHWVAYDIPVTDAIPEGVATLGTPGRNSWGRSGYGGPCPPSGSHRYFFTVYALDTALGLASGARKATLLEAMEGHVLAEATLLGRYSR
jgi:Raf kinase inhibitor-like YbhB/YbcL family protein